MNPPPSLREVFAALAGTPADPVETLRAAGYGDLPDDLLAEAIACFADTAPVEVAEHFARFVMEYSEALPDLEEPPESRDTSEVFALLSTAPPAVEPLDGDMPRGEGQGHQDGPEEGDRSADLLFGTGCPHPHPHPDVSTDLTLLDEPGGDGGPRGGDDPWTEADPLFALAGAEAEWMPGTGPNAHGEDVPAGPEPDDGEDQGPPPDGATDL
jgi:hypothetical protein